MEIGEVIRVSLRALARNKMRTILTMLGIVIGVGAVICTVAIGQGAAKQVQEQIASLGDNIIFISAGSIKTSGVHLGSQATKSLTATDGKAILAEVPFIKWVSPSVGYSGQLVYQANNWYTQVRGINPQLHQDPPLAFGCGQRVFDDGRRRFIGRLPSGPDRGEEFVFAERRPGGKNNPDFEFAVSRDRRAVGEGRVTLRRRRR